MYRYAEIDGDKPETDSNLNGDLERVRVVFPYTEEGLSPEDGADVGPVDWCNSAAIVVDEAEDSITLTISVGDPRGGFGFTLRRTPDGTLIMHTPTPGDGWLHAQLTELHPGTFRVGPEGGYKSAEIAEED